MSNKRKGRRKDQERTSMDMGLEPMFTFGKGKSARTLSAADVILHQWFKGALEGDPKSVARMVKIIRINHREWAKQEGLRGGDVPRERRGRRIVGADQALQILGVASKYHDGSVDCLGVASWVIDRTRDRMGEYAAQRVNWRSRWILPEGAQTAAIYSLEDELDAAPAKSKRPAGSTLFPPRKSGNYGGRPPQEKYEVPFEDFLHQPGTIRIDGVDRKVTRLEALVHQLNLRAIKGDERLAGLLGDMYVNELYARWKRRGHVNAEVVRGEDLCVADDPFCDFLRQLGLISRRTVRRVLLQPWIVVEALERMERRLSPKEQAVIVRSTSTPYDVAWPEWWEVRPAKPSRA